MFAYTFNLRADLLSKKLLFAFRESLKKNAVGKIHSVQVGAIYILTMSDHWAAAVIHFNNNVFFFRVNELQTLFKIDILNSIDAHCCFDNFKKWHSRAE